LEDRSQALTDQFLVICLIGKFSTIQASGRPYTLDYVDHIFTDFMSCMVIGLMPMILPLCVDWRALNWAAGNVIGHQKGRDTKEKIIVTLVCHVLKVTVRHCA